MNKGPQLAKAVPQPAADPLPVCTMLPPEARTLLIRAAAVNAKLAAGESHDRSVALDHAIQVVRSSYPQFFKREEENGKSAP